MEYKDQYKKIWIYFNESIDLDEYQNKFKIEKHLLQKIKQYIFKEMFEIWTKRYDKDIYHKSFRKKYTQYTEEKLFYIYI